MHYLDHAATTPVERAAADEMYRVLTEGYGNPSAQYALGRTARDLVATARHTVAEALGCEAKQFCFTSCGTESDCWAIQAALWQNRHVGRHIVTTAMEHSAVLQACKLLEEQGCEITYLSPRDVSGDISAEQVLAAVRPDTALVSVMLVNNELGNVYPVEEIAAGLAAKHPKTLLHTDAVQGFLKLPFRADRLGADLISVSAHKIGGPKGCGGLYIGPRVRNPRPLLPGGGQEGGARSGTEATAQIAGFAKAVEVRRDRLAEKLTHMARIKAYAEDKLTAMPDFWLVGNSAVPHILAASLAGYPSQNIVTDLDKAGVCISAGSACHQGKPSHVVAALGLSKKLAAGVIRLSFGPDTTEADIDAAIDALLRHRESRFPML